MDWKVIAAIFGGVALIFFALSFGDKSKPMGPREQRAACIEAMKTRPVAEIERVCGAPSWWNS